MKTTDIEFKKELKPKGIFTRSMLKRWKFEYYRKERHETPCRFYNRVKMFLKNL